MKTSIRLFGSALGAAAIIGSTAVGASAHDFGGGHHGDYSHSYSHHHRHGHHGAYSVRSAHHQYADFSRHHQGRGDDDSAFGVGCSFDHHWFRHHWGHHHHQHMTFAERQAAIVQRLTDADTRLGDLISRLQADAAQDPSGWEAQVVPYLQQQQQRLETLIAAVQAASDYQELADAFKAAFSAPPTSTPTPSPAPAG